MNHIASHIICDINDKTFSTEYISENIKDYHVRKAARGILVNNNKIALLNVSTKGYHKLPGGGIEGNESNEEAFKREVLEETGCQCKVLGEGPVTIEYRDQFKLVQISYVFMAEVVGTPGTPKLEQDEIDEGHDLEWFTVEEVKALIDKENPEGYEERFIHLRDKSIFEFYEKELQKIRNV